MRLSKQISDACKITKNSKIGKVTSISNNKITIQSDSEHRDLKNVSPFGIISTPPIGTKSVVTPVDDGFAYVGSIDQENNLEPGEIMLRSSGGANIVLKNNGQVLINGKAFE